MTPQPKAPQGTPAETTINTTRKQQPSDPGAAAKLPHERDQSVDMTQDTPHPEMKQAYSDLQRGLKDTDRGPPSDVAYKKL